MQVQTVQLLDRYTIESVALSQNATPEVQAFIALTQQVVDALLTDIDQMFKQKTAGMQQLITSLDAANGPQKGISHE